MLPTDGAMLPEEFLVMQSRSGQGLAFSAEALVGKEGVVVSPFASQPHEEAVSTVRGLVDPGYACVRIQFWSCHNYWSNLPASAQTRSFCNNLTVSVAWLKWFTVPRGFWRAWLRRPSNRGQAPGISIPAAVRSRSGSPWRYQRNCLSNQRDPVQG